MARKRNKREEYFKKKYELPKISKKQKINRGLSDYNRQRERLEEFYGLSEKQISRYIKESLASTEDPAIFLFKKLETRLDTAVFRMGFAKNIIEARNLINHGHISVNGRRIDSAIFKLKPRAIIELNEASFRHRAARKAKTKKPPDFPGWLERSGKIAKFKRLPKKHEAVTDINFQKIIRAYI